VGKNLIEFAQLMEANGAGEIVVNAIGNEGVMKGYDFDLIDKIRNSINLPMTVLGGAGSLDDIAKVIERYGIIGVAAGSLFVFKGIYRAVLINYPNGDDKERLVKLAHN
jgi:cyclase